MQRSIVSLIGILIILALILPVGVASAPTAGGAALPKAAQPGPSEAPSTPSGLSPDASWVTQCVDCPRSFGRLTSRRLRLDAAGRPHIAYGGDHLYHAWHDGTVWVVETVDSASAVGEHASLALDAVGRPHISYYHSDSGDLKYARFDGAAWQIETVDSGGQVGFGTSVAVDSAGQPHISYWDLSNDDLKYAHFDGSAWQIETVDSDGYVGSYNSLAVDAAGFPHIGYFDYSNYDLKYARFDGVAWQIETVDSGGLVGVDASLALDDAGRPHISYFDDSNLTLKYARFDGVAWQIETVDSTGDVGYDTSLALDGAGRPHISYYDTDNDDLRYARFDGVAWQIDTVDSGGDVGHDTSLALDDAGLPHISYLDSDNHDLKYARFDGAAWLIETVDSASNVGSYNSLAVDSADGPHISYYDAANQDLKYARFDGMAWQIETVDSGASVGSYTSLVLEGAGMPHISYCDSSNGDLKYAYFDGAAWQIETVDSVDNVGSYTSLALDSAAMPHISYYDATNRDLKYARFDGTAWQIETVDSVGYVGSYNSLAVDSAGRPHISYYNADSYDLKYARFDGAAWQIESVDTVGFVGTYSSLALDGAGMPHISYRDITNGDLKYAYFDGAAWQIETVDSVDDVGSYTSLALDDAGMPHISYRDSTNYDLKYACFDGAAWQIETVDTVGSVGWYTSVAVDGAGQPHISYYDYSNDDLKYATLSTEAYHISGQVTDQAGDPLPGVTVSATGGYSAITNANGDYSLTGLPQGSYTLTPSMAGYTFDPPSLPVTVPPDAEDQDFAGTLLTYTVSGQVTDQPGDPLPGVTVSASGGYSAITNANGDYNLTGLPQGSYTLTPSKAGYTFDPPTLPVTVPPPVGAQDFTALFAAADLAAAMVDFVADSQQKLGDLSIASAEAAEAGDYFLDKMSVDAANRWVNLGLNAIDLVLVGVNWSKVGPGLKDRATPGCNEALLASWRGWMDPGLAMVWHRLLYEGIHNNRKLLFRETAWAGLKYYAWEAGVEAVEGPIKDWMLAELLPGDDTPIVDNYGVNAQWLADRYRSELQRELDEFLDELPGLGITPEQEYVYMSDLLARGAANLEIQRQVQFYHDLLWDNYQDVKADDANWLKGWSGFLIRTAATTGAAAAWDGPGYVVASAVFASYSTVFDFYRDTQALENDEKAFDAALHLLTGRMPSAYGDISMNTVAAMNLIRAGLEPQMAGGDVGVEAQKSFGHYRLWPDLWWDEDSSLVELPIANTAVFSVTYLTSASYYHDGSGFWSEWKDVAVSGEAPELDAGQEHTALLWFRTSEDGVSPREDGLVDLEVLGATETGIYPVASRFTYWNPARIDTLSGAPARLPAGYTWAEADSAPTRPHPLSSLVATLPGSTDHTLAVAVSNPFTLTLSATVTQTVPAEFSVVDAGGAQLIGDELVWTGVISPHVALELRAVLGWEGVPGDSTIVPGAVLVFEDPDTGEGDTYTTDDEEVTAPWPLEVAAGFPLTWACGAETPITITVSNISTAVVADGQLETTVSSPDGVLLWSASVPLEVQPGQSETLVLAAEIDTDEPFAVVAGQISLGSVQREAFLEIVEVERHRIYLPLILRGY